MVIRNFTVQDWESLAEIVMKYEASGYAKYDYGPWPDDPDSYKSIVEDWSTKNEFVAVQLKAQPILIGYIHMGQDENGEYNLGYVFHPQYHGSGYATEACQAVIAFLFDVVQVDRIVSGTAKANIPSRNLLARLGFIAGKEETIALRQDSAGRPIEFVGIDFSLSRADWKKL